LSFTLGLLAEPQNAAVADRSRQEAIKTTTAGLKRDHILESTAYMDNVFNESLRLFPLAPTLAGKCYEDFEVKEGQNTYLVPKGAKLAWHNLSGQRCARIWPDPDRVNPDHWNGNGSKNNLMTFNMGAHACPGKNLSHLEARIFLTMVLSKFRFELPEGVDKTEGYNEFLLRPKDGMPLRVFRL